MYHCRWLDCLCEHSVGLSGGRYRLRMVHSFLSLQLLPVFGCWLCQVLPWTLSHKCHYKCSPQMLWMRHVTTVLCAISYLLLKTVLLWTIQNSCYVDLHLASGWGCETLTNPFHILGVWEEMVLTLSREGTLGCSRNNTVTRNCPSQRNRKPAWHTNSHCRKSKLLYHVKSKYQHSCRTHREASESGHVLGCHNFFNCYFG